MTGLPVADLARPDTIRLINASHHKEPALAPLADDPGAAAALARLESATNGRLAAQRRGLPALSPDEFVYHVPGWNLINAAFAYARPGGNRFNGPDRGAWYAAFAIETATAEVGFHLTRALADAGEVRESVAYVALHADFIGRFADLRGVADSPALDPDPAIGYPAGQDVAREARSAGLPGIVYPSVRHPGGTCLAALTPHAVQNVRQGETRRLVWDGTPEWRVEAV